MSGLHLQGLTSFIDQVAQETLAERKIAGVSVSVADRGDLVHATGYGYASIERRIAAEAATIYSIGSMTKQFTSVAILQLVERGRLRLEDPVTAELPLKRRLTSRPSIRQVLAHTAGICSDVERLMLADSRDSNALTRERALSLVTDKLFDAKPGEVWRYSNFGYYLLGIAIEEITGMTYSEYLLTNVLQAAGLSNTSYGMESVNPHRFAHGYTEQEGSFASVDVPRTEQTFSSGGLFSNVVDLQLWSTALHDRRLLTDRSYIAMTTPTRLLDGRPTTYGLGCFLGACGDCREIGHDGTSGGYSAQAAYYPEANLSVVVLMNCERHEAERLEKTISRRILRVPKLTDQERHISIHDLGRYVGMYTHKGVDIAVRADGTGLVISVPNRPILRLRYQGETVFAQRDDPSTRYEFIVHSERADSFVVSREGKTIANARRLS